MTFPRTIVFASLLFAALPGCSADADGELSALPQEEIAESSAAATAVLPVDPCGATPFYTHVTTAGNVPPSGPLAHTTELNNIAFNGVPKALLVVTPNWTPQGNTLAEVHNYHPIGVFYNDAAKRWTVYNEDNAPMPLGTGFNVRLVTGATARSPSPSTTSFEAVRAGGGAHVFATANFRPGGGLGLPGANNWNPLSARISLAPYAAWDLVAGNAVAFDANVAFNVADLSCASVHTTTVGNVTGADTVLPGVSDPSSVVLAMPITPKCSVPTSTDPQQLAVRFEAGSWRIHSWSNTVETMAVGAQINVVVGPPTP